jgi:excisionase family DNA binding protein
LDDWATPAFVEPDATPLAEYDGDPMGAMVYATVRAEVMRVEGILREHLETHALEEWFTEVIRLRALLSETPQPPPAAHVDRRATAAEVAKALGVGASVVGSYARQGRIPHSWTLGGHRRFNVDEVRDALDNKQVAR